MEQYRDDIDLILKAISFASDKHRDQRRKDREASPYINHPIALASVLKHEGDIDDPVVITAAILHDTIEDTNTTEAELREVFGDTVASVVLEVTDDKSLDKAERKRLQVAHAPKLSTQARLVKLADKICNLRDIISSPPDDWDDARKCEYFAWAKSVVNEFRGTHDKLESVFDETYAEWEGRNSEDYDLMCMMLSDGSTIAKDMVTGATIKSTKIKR